MRSGVLGRHRALRWVLPVGVVATVGGVGFAMLSAASADSALPTISATELAHSVTAANVSGLSGTLLENANLGLPDLGALTGSTGVPSDLLTGSHTVRVWYAGAQRQRLAVMDKDGETDLFHDGTDVWEWDSTTQTATHSTLGATPASSLTPSQLAQKVLGSITSATTLSLDPEQRVADRPSYQLVVTPAQAGSRIGSVVIAVDGQTRVPLGVQVYAKDDAKNPVFDMAFSEVNFSMPDEDNFTFTPPKSATVVQRGQSAGTGLAAGVLKSVKTIGSGWTTVLEVPEASVLPTADRAIAGVAIGLLPAVSGTWGSGHLFTSALITGLVTADGRILVGAVDPSVLYDAAAK